MGVGGALQPHLNIGDTVISSRIVQHDSVFSGEDGNKLMAPGELYLSVPISERRSPAFEVDRKLLGLINRVIERESQGHRTYVGTVLSGNEFVASIERKNQLRRLVENPLLVEMEAFGVAFVAKRLGIPFIMIKTVADSLNPHTSISSEYKECIESASANAASIFEAVTRYMATPI
jgi:nucleoside phosphorylase